MRVLVPSFPTDVHAVEVVHVLLARGEMVEAVTAEMDRSIATPEQVLAAFREWAPTLAERYPMPRNLSSAPAFVRRDSNLLRLLEMATTATHEPGRWQEELHALTDHPAADLLLEHLLGSGRLCWERPEQPLTRGPDLSGQLAWLSDPRGAQTPAVHLPDAPDAQLLPVAPPWAVRPTALTLSRVQTDAPAEVTARFLSGPVLPPAQAVALAHAITASGLNLPIPQTVQVREERLPYTPQLHLLAREATHHAFSGARHTVTLPLAELRHAYAGLTVPDDHAGTGPAVFRGGVLTRVTRDPAAEREAAHTVALSGFMLLDDAYGHEYTVPGGDHLLTLGDDDAWMDFMRAGRADLEAQGFTIHVHPEFPLNFAEITDWYGETDDSHGGWFTLDLGIVVDGQRLSLIPILADLIARQPQLFTPEALAELKDDEVLHASLGDGRRVALPAGRVRAILGVLVELNLRDLPPGPLRLPLLDAARVAQLEEAVQARWLGAERLLDLGRRLRDFRGVQDITPPQGLRADLRPYQRQGVAWLQFLREYGMGGILADDMGLGKTVQTLAWLLHLADGGAKKDFKVLVVCPKSVTHGWMAETGRFASALPVTAFTPALAETAGPPAGLLVANYAQLRLHAEWLKGAAWDAVVLDEGQFIKNPDAKVTQTCFAVRAAHRIVLTGTPLENRQLDLWSIFRFLLPGLLGSRASFEAALVADRDGTLTRLRTQLSPFILRRTKGEVAKELPPKVEMDLICPLTDVQRAEYARICSEGLERLGDDVGAAMREKSFGFLALLTRLRQTCCDPDMLP